MYHISLSKKMLQQQNNALDVTDKKTSCFTQCCLAISLCVTRRTTRTSSGFQKAVTLRTYGKHVQVCSKESQLRNVMHLLYLQSKFGQQRTVCRRIDTLILCHTWHITANQKNPLSASQQLTPTCNTDTYKNDVYSNTLRICFFLSSLTSKYWYTYMRTNWKQWEYKEHELMKYNTKQ